VAKICPGNKAGLLMMMRCDQMLSLELRADWDGDFANNNQVRLVVEQGAGLEKRIRSHGCDLLSESHRRKNRIWL